MTREDVGTRERRWVTGPSRSICGPGRRRFHPCSRLSLTYSGMGGGGGDRRKLMRSGRPSAATAVLGLLALSLLTNNIGQAQAQEYTEEVPGPHGLIVTSTTSLQGDTLEVEWNVPYCDFVGMEYTGEVGSCEPNCLPVDEIYRAQYDRSPVYDFEVEVQREVGHPPSWENVMTFPVETSYLGCVARLQNAKSFFRH